MRSFTFLSAKLMIYVFLVFAIFIFFNPNFSEMDTKSLFSLKPTHDLIKLQIYNNGLLQTLYSYGIKAPILEEIIYRGPIWIACVVLGLLKIKNHFEKSFLMWIALLIPTLQWSLLHPYSPFFQACVFFGGLLNGLIIIFLMEKKWGRATIMGSLPLVITCHSVFNCFVVLIINHLP